MEYDENGNPLAPPLQLQPVQLGSVGGGAPAPNSSVEALIQKYPAIQAAAAAVNPALGAVVGAAPLAGLAASSIGGSNTLGAPAQTQDERQAEIEAAKAALAATPNPPMSSEQTGNSEPLPLTPQPPAHVNPELVKMNVDAAKSVVEGAAQARQTVSEYNQKIDEIENQRAIKQAAMEAEMTHLATIKKEGIQKQQELVEQYNQRQAMMIEEVRKASADPIDPNRYWNNKNVGQRALAVLAGALFGYTGRGMQWIQHLDGLVAEDNRLQQAEKQAKVQGLQYKAEQMGEIGKRAIAAGASVYEAKALETQAKFEGARNHLQYLVDSTKNAELKVRGQEMLGQLDAKIAGVANNALSADTNRISVENAAAQHAFALSLKAKGLSASGGGNVSDLTKDENKRLQDYDASLDLIKEARTLVGGGSLSEAALDSVARLIPGGKFRNVKERSDQLKFLARAIFKSIDQSVINQADQEFINKISSGVGLNSLNIGDWKAFEKIISANRNSILRNAQKTGRRVGTYTERAYEGDAGRSATAAPEGFEE